MFTWLLLILALLALLAGGLLLLWMRRAQMRTGLPAGQVVYSDTGVERAVTKPLVSHRLGLIGKPDYLVEVQGGGRRFLVPVEVKSRRGTGATAIRPSAPVSRLLLAGGRDAPPAPAPRRAALRRRQLYDSLHR